VIATRLALAFGCAFFAAAAAAAGEPPATTPPEAKPPAVADPEPTPEQAARIAQLLRELGDAKWEVRDRAYQALLDIGRPALGALRAAVNAKDPEVSGSAVRLVEDIQKNIRARVRIKTLRPTTPGEREVILEVGDLTVTVRESPKEFSVAVKKGGAAAEVSTAPNAEEFKKKHPELWKKWAEPALDASDPDKLMAETLVRELLPKVLEKFAKQSGRQPTADETAEAEKLLREEVRKTLAEKRKQEGEKKQEPPKPPPPPPPPPAPAPPGP
jgi:hypothetical protein